MEAPCFVASKTTRKSEAAALLEFVATAEEAHKVMLSAGVMLEDGSRAATYTDASARMMPAYRSLAKQLAEDYAKGARNCLDLGCGPGEFTTEVAKATGLEVTGLDVEPEATDLGRQYAEKNGLGSRMHWIAADVHSLPYADSSFDLVISRGSIFFWRDQVTALREIMRVLKPGGWAFIGGGYGRYVTKAEWETIHPGMDPNKKEAQERFHFPFPLTNVPALMARSGIGDYRHITEGGSWIEFRKPQNSGAASTGKG